jgi:hypothetical protein
MAILTAVVLAGALAANSAQPAQKKGGREKGLNAAEKRAIKIVSVEATTSERAGVLIDVGFAGNIERALGQGGLAKGFVAVILHPRATGAPSSYIATRGAGAIGETLTKSVSGKVGIVRGGSHVLFVLEGPGLGDFGSVEVKALTEVPRLRAKPATIPADGWTAIDEVIAGEEKALTDLEAKVQDPLECDRIKTARDKVFDFLLKGERRARSFDSLRKKIDAGIKQLEERMTTGKKVSTAYLHGFGAPWAALMKAITGETPVERFETAKAALRSARLDRKLVDALDAKNKKLTQRLLDLYKVYEAAIADCEKPPTLKPIRARFDDSVYTTFYTEEATDVLNRPLTYEWAVSIPVDPGCATGFKPSSPQPNMASWYHRDTVEGGPCDHAKYDEDGSGHPGDVVVVVSNGIWKCAATFHGTQGDEGEPTALGESPQECTR